VRIYLYPSPIVLHSKYMTVDDEVGVIGSSNMDFRSFALNYEVMLLAFGGDLDDLLRNNDAAYRALGVAAPSAAVVPMTDRAARPAEQGVMGSRVLFCAVVVLAGRAAHPWEGMGRAGSFATAWDM